MVGKTKTPVHTPVKAPASNNSVDATPTTDPDQVDGAELTALIKAINFAHPEFGVKRMHTQILTHGGKFARVPLKRVRRYMHKLGMTGQDDACDHTSPVKLMTVGGASKSKREHDHDGEVPHETTNMVWLPVKLDEPASKMKEFPYQAVIRMTTSDEGDAQGAMGEIYKIQVAMEADGSLSTIHPMLVYNKDRTRKTFLHPDSPAYLPVQRLVSNCGQVGTVGGSKAYFWGRYFQVEDMLYINTEKLAPFQQW